MKGPCGITKNEQGQAVTEYLLLVAAVLFFYMIVVGFLNSYGLVNKLMTPITGDFARTYEYGKNDVKGFDNGGPYDHPRALGDNNFRIFINPKQ